MSIALYDGESNFRATPGIEVNLLLEQARFCYGRFSLSRRSYLILRWLIYQNEKCTRVKPALLF